MLKATNNKFIFLGLEQRNLEKLKAGDPILVRGVDINEPKDIVIFFGETPKELIKELKDLTGLKTFGIVPHVGRVKL